MVTNGYRTAAEVQRVLLDNQEEVVNQVEHEDVDIYLYLYGELKKPKSHTNDYLCRFVYRNYYKLDNPSLTPEFEEKYFEIMDKERVNAAHPAIIHLSNILYNVKNKNGNHSLQFSLTASMLHTLNPYFPSYDNAIVKLFKFTSCYHLAGFSKKMARYVEQYQHQFSTYQTLLSDEALIPLFDHFDQKFSDKQYHYLPKIKKLDLMIHQAAKLVSGTQ